MNDDLQELQRQITHFKTNRTNLKQEIKKLKTESGLKLEAIIRHQEKKNALAMEAKDREEEHKKLEENLQDKLELRKKSPKKAAETGANKFADSEEREKLIEKFASLLENKISNPIQTHIQNYLNEAYGIPEPGVPEEKEIYTKSAALSTILVVLEEEVNGSKRRQDRTDTITEEAPLTDEEQQTTTIQQYLATFRVAQSTKLQDLKEKACEFWNKKGEAENYEFYDEEGVLLEGPLLETRFIKKRNQLTQLMVIMKRRNQASIIINKPETEKKGNRDENQGLQNNIDPYKNFDTLLPKLKPFIDIDKYKTQEREKKFKKMNDPKTFGENHVTITVILITILVLTIVSIVKPKDLRKEYNVVGSVDRKINSDDFYKVESLDNLLEILISNTSPLFPIDNSTSLRTYKPFYIRQYRVRKTPCRLNFVNKNCYFEKYDLNTRDTETFSDGFQNHVFEETVGNSIQGIIKGEFGSYDGESYLTTIYQGETQAQFIEKICKLFAITTTSKQFCIQSLLDLGEDPTTLQNDLSSTSMSYINESTRALRLSMHVFDIAEENFYFIEPLMEFTPFGTILTTIPRTIAFKPNLKENYNRSQFGISVACVVFASFLLLFVLYNLFTTGNGGINFGYFMTLQGILNLIIIILIYVIHTLMSNINNFNITESILIRDVNPKVVNDLAIRYETIFILKAILAGFVIFRVTLLFKLNTRIETIVNTLETVMPNLILMVVTILPIMLTLAFFGHYTLGLHNLFFSTYRGALMLVSLLLVGFQTNIVYSFNVAEAILIFFGLFFVYSILLSLVAAINVENYRQSKLEYAENYYSQFTWKFRDYLSWAFAWVPSRITKTRQKLKTNLSDLKTNLKFSKVSNLLKKNENKYKSQEKNEKDNMS